MKVSILTREWPPDVYGGAGVHVTHLVDALRDLIDVEVECFGEPRAEPGVRAHGVPEDLVGANPALATLGVDLEMVRDTSAADLVHSHTWYTNLAGHVAGLLHGVPHVITAHSLEPMRPWKAEQLGGGYRVSSWVEQTSYEHAQAVIAVSAGMRRDVLSCYPSIDPDRVHVVHNGIDTEVYRPMTDTEVLTRFGISLDRPCVLFVGRITRQKGIAHLLAAAERFEDDVTLVLCASSPDTPEIGAEIEAGVARLKERRGDAAVVWIEEQLDRDSVISLLSHAQVFACPSIYEPLGIVNLEAMACETAVVASAVGGIPEVVDDRVTGLLVPYDPAEPRAFEHAFADAVNDVIANPQRAHAFGLAGRARAIAHFGWHAIALQTVGVYESALAK